MARIRTRSLAEPDDLVEFPGGIERLVRLGELVVGRETHHPGWRWSTHIKPIVGGESCQFTHRGIVLSGRMGVRMDDGEERILGPEEVFIMPPGHDAWVEGDEDVVTLVWVGAEGWTAPLPDRGRRIGTILFIDIVSSTERAARLGDAAWRRTQALHDETVRGILADFGGREISTAGDSFLVVFDAPGRAVRCAVALVSASRAMGVDIRAGLHSGEIEEVDGDVRGLAVNYAARVTAAADPGEVLVSATTRELAEGSGLAFETRGRRALKGLDGERELFALRVEERRAQS